MNHLDLVGKKLRHFVVQDFLRKESRVFKSGTVADYLYLCLCVCGATFEATRRSIISDHIASCGCQRWHKGTKNGKWKGHGLISGNFWAQVKRHALSRSLPFDISLEQAWLRFESQGGLCALSGTPLILGDPINRKTNTASMDRIDSTLGYTVDNIQWVHKDINYMKSDTPEEEFVQWCRLVSSHKSRACEEEDSSEPDASLF